MQPAARSTIKNRIKGALKRLADHTQSPTGRAVPDPERTYRTSLNYHLAAVAFTEWRPRFRIVLTIDPSLPYIDLGTLNPMIGSVRMQAYDNWELVLVVPEAWERTALESLQRCCEDIRSRTSIIRHGENISPAGFDYLVVLDDKTILTPFCLAVILRELRATHHRPDLIYGDRAWIDRGTSRLAASLRPDWSPRLLASYRYMGHPLIFSFAWLERCGFLHGRFEPGFEWRWLAQGLLRIETGRRLPQFLGVSVAVPQMPASHPASTDGHAIDDCVVIIPTRDQTPLLKKALASLRQFEPGSDLEVLVVDNRSDHPDEIAAIARDHGARVLPFDYPFNYSALNNWAVAQTERRLVLLLNNDVEFLERHTLSRMAERAVEPGIGAVGCRLAYEDGSVQHGGVLLSRRFLANHFFRGHKNPVGPSTDLVECDREVSAVTAAFLMIERTKFLAVGGFDETTFPIGYSDVDLCLRLGRSGLQNFYMGSIGHAHFESKSRGWADESFERMALQRAFPSELDDPFFHPEARQLDFGVSENLDHLYAGIRPLLAT